MPVCGGREGEVEGAQAYTQNVSAYVPMSLCDETCTSVGLCKHPRLFRDGAPQITFMRSRHHFSGLM